ncbi:DoxX family protein [Flavobacterium sp. F-65]|uniref:DoxX family protein n=1 Tax=Flavobacterium pisciphilum TaxID=2893755 RepID=A0ABS8MU59_9FLAO|nr:DoxX family protein [Flavobacterium sp. F-65]MCC9072178.1 DoxX family protein [Flavobacterium sp. F-65]
MKKNQNIGLLILRITIAFPMFIYGISKLFNGISFIQNVLEDKGLPIFLSYGVYVGEIIAPLLMIIGFRTRLAAVFFSINCLTAIFLTQTAFIFQLNENGGWALELLGIYLFGAIGIYFTGAGKIALSSKSKWD